MAEIPYYDEASYHADPKLKKLIYSKTTYKGKGWTEVEVGKKKIITRDDPKQAVRNILAKDYPEYKDVDLFTSMSYHAPISKKVSKYGSKKYMLQKSILKKIGVYELEKPIRSQRKRDFGKVIKKVPLYEWDYGVIDWFGDDPRIQLKRQVSDPFGNLKKVYQGDKVATSKSEKLIKQLKGMMK